MEDNCKKQSHQLNPIDSALTVHGHSQNRGTVASADAEPVAQLLEKAVRAVSALCCAVACCGQEPLPRCLPVNTLKLQAWLLTI